LQQQINESTIWEEEKQKQNKLKKKGKLTDVSLKELFSVKENRKALFLLIGIY
jgi:inositol transporter-like SP family MFS transporter